MAERSEIADLEERRRSLLAESDRLRQQLTAEVARLEPAVALVDRGLALARSVRHFWPILAGAAGFFLARKRRSAVGTLSRVVSWWRLGKKLVGFWRAYSAASHSERAS
jgi:hypothetical protein